MSRSTPIGEAPGPGGRRGWMTLAIAALCLLVFGQVLGFEFVDLDDYAFVVQNASLRDGLGLQGLYSALQPRSSNWIPLTELSFRLDYALYGLEPAGFHATNLLLHTASGLLLWCALRRLSGRTWESWVVAAIFAVHPLHVESVAWVSERKDVLSGLLWMSTLYMYARYCERPGTARYAGVVALFALGLLAKPMVVTLPFVLLLLDYWPLNRLKGRVGGAPAWRRTVLEKLPMIALSALASVITLEVQRASGAVSGLLQLPLSLRVANAVDAYASYLAAALWPAGLAAFYPHPLSAIAPGRLVIESLLLLALSAAALLLGRRRGYLAVGWLWFLGTLVPVIGLVQVGMQARADRYMYLPLVGLSVAIVWGVGELAERFAVPPRWVVAAWAAAVLALAFVGGMQARTWRNTASLYERALEVTESNYLAHDAMGSQRLREGRLAEAEDHFEEALRLAPEWAAPQLGLADVELGRGRVHRAIARYERVLARDATNSGARGRYGLALGLVGRYDEARIHITRALEARGGVAELHRGLAEIEAALGNLAAAQRHAREALRLDPAYTDAANLLAWLLATAADPTLRSPREAISVLEPHARGSEAWWLLDTQAAAYASAGRFDDALPMAERAARSAEREGLRGEAEAIRARARLYRAGEPYVEPLPVRAGRGAVQEEKTAH